VRDLELVLDHVLQLLRRVAVPHGDRELLLGQVGVGVELGCLGRGLCVVGRSTAARRDGEREAGGRDGSRKTTGEPGSEHGRYSLGTVRLGGSRDQPGTTDQMRSVAAEINMSKTLTDIATWKFDLCVEFEFNLGPIAVSG